MASPFSDTTAEFRLYQLISPSLPIGAFTYSQGLEWAVEQGWVHDKITLGNWLRDMLSQSLITLELPVLRRLYQAWQCEDTQAIAKWNQWLYASRETKELRQEEKQRGQATATLLQQLEIPLPQQVGLVGDNQLSGFALAATHWGIEMDALCRGYLWSWLENTTMAGVKLIPLGQTAGQQLLLELSSVLAEAVARSAAIPDHEVSSFAPAQAIASSRHETQYTRLFRS
ncbi:urease accessory protein UreF [Photobacterium halotolerans]|uniref:Urease accessory protein UreF n=1 Tax=Photobacterium halotolerans TaxID=265726 RepID=A0A7X4W8H0_9GAMM|nr:urease accessory protein UreF [Photobacterium halotolerans]NAW64134.1 urease accessory protein UreF [Photobacterium halotolerans]NAX49125.1 urease accessory protein UreF [Photobacterium halotolerans]